MARWNTELTTPQDLKDFWKFLGDRHKSVWAQARVYGNIRKATGNPLVLMTPANTYNSGPDLLTLEIIDNLVNAPVSGAACPTVCSQAWSQTANLPEGRDVKRYQTALQQLKAANVNISGLTASLRGLLPTLEQAIDVPYVNDYLPNATQRAEEARKAKAEDERQQAEDRRLTDVATRIRRVMNEQRTKLEGTLKNKQFVYYERLVVPSAYPGGRDLLNEQDVLIIEDGNGAFREFNQGRCIVGTITEKGTRGIGGDKYFKFRSTLMSQQDMFDALRKTGWNMANLNAANKLEKVN
jgi:hypothetical protein